MTIGTGADRPDDQLLVAVAAGEEAAFRQLYRRHTPRMRMLVLRILGGAEHDADDVVQESWVRAIARLESFRGDSTFATWLRGIGIRVAWELIRQRRGALSLDDDMVSTESRDVGERIDLEAALRRLPAAWRAVVVLHDVEGFRHDEIAAALDVAVATSRSHLFRARRALRESLRSYERIRQ
jgi:RNA polymerase sigma-70 factor (ECF subfamily)